MDIITPPKWREEKNALIRVFEFENFVKAVEFVNKIVPLAEEISHHPDIEIFSYKKVRIRLSTHEAGNKVTEKDKILADKIESLYILYV